MPKNITATARELIGREGARIVIHLQGDPIKFTLLDVRPATNGDLLLDVRIGPLLELTIRQHPGAPVEVVVEINGAAR
jgi:hypothetical protein